MEELVKKTLTEEIYEEIRDMILNNELKPDQSISIKPLALELDVSQTPVREALIKLRKDGLVNYERRKNFEVSKLTEDEINKAYEARRYLEPYLVEIVAKDPPVKELTQLKELMEDLPHHTGEEVYELFHKTDLELENIIINTIDNNFLSDIFEYLGNHTLRIRFLAEAKKEGSEDDIINKGNKEHLRIVNALLQSKPEEARDATFTHLKLAEERSIDAFNNN